MPLSRPPKVAKLPRGRDPGTGTAGALFITHRTTGEPISMENRTMRARTVILTLLFTAASALPSAVAVARAQTERDQRRIAGSEPWTTDFTVSSVPFSEIVSGGPLRDGIPAIDSPKFVTAEAADEWLEGADPVVVVEEAGVVKAYPLGILIWHEIVNDVVGSTPVTITFCPLCNTALAFDRRLDGRTLDFGTTGRLRHSDLIMYDRQTESWWQQAIGEAIVGELTGRRLDLVSANTLGWHTARSLYPGILVLSRDTGFPSYQATGMYGRNPYTGYDDPQGAPWSRFISVEADPTLPAMERVATIDEGDGWAAAFSDLSSAGPAHVELDARTIVVFWASGAASATDREDMGSSRDVGQTAAFESAIDGRTLRFEVAGDGFRDGETGSTWNLAGQATDGPLAGARLKSIPHGNHFWFAWVVFRPDTEVWRP